MRKFCFAFLALVPLAAAQQRVQAIGTPTAVVRYQNLRSTMSTVATVATDEATLSTVTARFSGWIESVAVNTTYARVRRGQVLCTIYSPDLYAAEQDYVFAAHNRAALAASPVEGVAAGAAALAADARQRLAQMQVPAAEITRLETGGAARQRFPVTAPEDGLVLRRNALPNLHVAPGTRLYTLEALDPIWVEAQVQENDLGRMRVGQAATVAVDAWPGRAFPARVSFLVPQVNTSSRTGEVRLVLANRDRALAPGMQGTVTIAIDLGRRLVVPANAVLQSGTGALTFVALGAGEFDPRAVEIGPQVGDEIVIRQGLKAGERVAVGANFLIASEAQLSAAAGSYAPPPPGVSAHAARPGAAAHVAPPAGALRFALATAPSPARAGRNTFRLALTTATGAPVTGVQVTLTLSMPAMPAMGMAAMNVTVPLADQGGGRYSGSGTLASAGEWRAAITVRKGGAVLEELHTTLRAGGGS